MDVGKPLRQNNRWYYHIIMIARFHKSQAPENFCSNVYFIRFSSSRERCRSLSITIQRHLQRSKSKKQGSTSIFTFAVQKLKELCWHNLYRCCVVCLYLHNGAVYALWHLFMGSNLLPKSLLGGADTDIEDGRSVKNMDRLTFARFCNCLPEFV